MRALVWVGTAVLAIGVVAALTAVVVRGAPRQEPEVVVYTSVDQVYSEPLLKQFERETGVRVRPVYDVEAAKTTGLVQRLIAERDRPRADVFWSSEIVQTMRLEAERALESYRSAAATALPPVFVDDDGHWTGFACRARVLLVNTEILPPERRPSSVWDLLDPAWEGDTLGIAHPLFGTTATHAAALYATLGPEAGRRFFEDLVARGVQVVDGNSVVKERVAQAQLGFGLTDSDDAARAVEAGYPVAVVVPDQGEGQAGTLLIPNTVALISGSPHPEQGRRLVDYLLTPGVERSLAEAGWTHFPVHAGVAVESPGGGQSVPVRPMEVDYLSVFEQFERAARELREVVVR